MKGEINREWYCSACCAFGYSKCDCDTGTYATRYDTRKYPTPEQFREEYGEEYPDDGAVWYLLHSIDEWVLGVYRNRGCYKCPTIVCACTPWGKPPDNWRPK